MRGHRTSPHPRPLVRAGAFGLDCLSNDRRDRRGDPRPAPGRGRVEADEIWSFCYSKRKNVPEEFQDTTGYGDVWTWVAIDATTKLVPSWLDGERTTIDG